jgi:hypothetical protein
MRYKPILLLVFLSSLLLLVPKAFTAHAAVNYPSIKHILLRANNQTSSLVPGTPTDTSTPSPTPSDTPTTTLMPLPAITLIFPISTTTSTATRTPKQTDITVTPTPYTPEKLSTLPPRLTFLFVLLIILWVILASFIIIYIRQFK